MPSRDRIYPVDFGYIACPGGDEFFDRDEPEIIVDPVNCMVVAVIPRTERPTMLPSRPPRDRAEPVWRRALRRFSAGRAAMASRSAGRVR